MNKPLSIRDRERALRHRLMWVWHLSGRNPVKAQAVQRCPLFEVALNGKQATHAKRRGNPAWFKAAA